MSRNDHHSSCDITGSRVASASLYLCIPFSFVVSLSPSSLSWPISSSLHLKYFPSLTRQLIHPHPTFKTATKSVLWVMFMVCVWYIHCNTSQRSIRSSFITTVTSSMSCWTICHDNSDHSSPVQRLQIPRFPSSLIASQRLHCWYFGSQTSVVWYERPCWCWCVFMCCNEVLELFSSCLLTLQDLLSPKHKEEHYGF